MSAISSSRAVPTRTIPTSSKAPETQAASRFQRIAPTRVIKKEIANAIHTFSGIQLRLACNEIMVKQGHKEETGKAKITLAFNLPCKYVIHTVGPIVRGKLTEKDCDLLKSCYISSLEIAEKNHLNSIAFCCISTGEFRFPTDKASEIAINTVKEYKEKTHSKIKVIFNVFKDKDYEIYRRLLK